MTTIREREVKISWCRQIATILESTLKQHKLEEWCSKVQPEDEGFNTACDYVGLRHEVMVLTDTLKQMANYMEIINKSEEEQ